MKKLLLSVGLFSMASLTFAQGTKISLNSRSSGLEKKIKPSSSNKAVAGGITCNSTYASGSQVLNFTLTLSNLDEEYVDSLAITFPAGIVPVTSTNNPFAPATAGQPAEALNGVSGQTISWGDNDDSFGGIATPVPTGSPISYNFSVDVTIDPSVTGNQTATFHMSGDGYGPNPEDLDGSITIFPAGAVLPDLQLLAVRPLNNISLDRACSYAQDTVFAVIKNIGNTTESNVTVNYSINGGTPAQAVAVVLGATPNPSIAPGDTAYAFFIPAFDFTGSGIKDMKAWVALSGDVSTTNDTITESFVNSASTALSTSDYTNGIETDYDFESLLSTWNGIGIGFGASTATVHTGSQALFYTVNTQIGAPAGNYETYLVLPCTDVVQGDNYRISYWRKSNTSTSPANINGSTAIFVGLGEDIASLSDTLKPYSAITANAPAGAWQKDSVDYVATATGTMYFAIAAKGTVSATDGVNVRIDAINITKVQSSSIDENAIISIVYPNPASDELNFKVNGKISSITINTLDGRVVKNSTLSTIDVSTLSPGMYIYNVNVDGKVAKGNFVKN
jgi:hypothetical protein